MSTTRKVHFLTWYSRNKLVWKVKISSQFIFLFCLTGGAIAGIIVGVLCFIILIVILMWCIIRWCKKSKTSAELRKVTRKSLKWNPKYDSQGHCPTRDNLLAVASCCSRAMLCLAGNIESSIM